MESLGNIRTARLGTNKLQSAHMIDRLLVCTLIELDYPSLRRTVNEILDTVQAENLAEAWEFWDQFSCRLDELAVAFGK